MLSARSRLGQPEASDYDIPAPAKLNLFLHVVGRRADGYHLLQTAFRLLDWGDTLDFTRRDDGVIRRTTDIAGIAPEHDLVVRAARLLQAHTGCQLGADIAERGMMLTGGGALLRDLDRLLAEETGLPVLVAEDPLTCVARGGGMALAGACVCVGMGAGATGGGGGTAVAVAAGLCGSPICQAPFSHTYHCPVRSCSIHTRPRSSLTCSALILVR